MDQKNSENPETAKLREVILQYKEGNLRIDEASSEIKALSGLMPEIAECFLKVMKRKNIISLDINSKTNNRPICETD